MSQWRPSPFGPAYKMRKKSRFSVVMASASPAFVIRLQVEPFPPDQSSFTNIPEAEGPYLLKTAVCKAKLKFLSHSFP